VCVAWLQYGLVYLGCTCAGCDGWAEVWFFDGLHGIQAAERRDRESRTVSFSSVPAHREPARGAQI
jgi:hypothetical protein